MAIPTVKAIEVKKLKTFCALDIEECIATMGGGGIDWVDE